MIYLPFLIEIMTIEKVTASSLVNEENVLDIRNLKGALNHRLVLKKVRRAIDFDQKACLKPYINMNNEHKK